MRYHEPMMFRGRALVPVSLFFIVVGLGVVWYHLRTQRLAAPATLLPGTQVQEERISVGLFAYSITPNELDTQSSNMPDYLPLPRNCQPIKNLYSYTNASEAKYIEVFSWDNTSISSQNTSKTASLKDLTQNLDALHSQADAAGRLPMEAEFSLSEILPWKDAACDVISQQLFQPVLMQKPAVEGYDQAWYLESIENELTLPAHRWLFLQRGESWVVIHQETAPQTELEVLYDTLQARLSSSCQLDTLSSVEALACVADKWFEMYRSDTVSQAWIKDQVARLEE